MSKLYFRYGAMNCGKSTNLLQVAYNYEERGMKVIIIKPRRDTKGGDRIISRLGISRKVDLLVGTNDSIYEDVKRWIETEGKVHCILVDEVQFFKAGHIDELFEIAVELDIPTICYGLRTDFQMNGFEGSSRLLLIAHSIEELKTICKCGKKALLNGRKINGTFVFKGEQIVIDDKVDVQYESLCPKCYLQFKKEFYSRRDNRDVNCLNLEGLR